jgi:hypothetical protein
VNAYSKDLRLRVLEAVDRGLPRGRIAELFGVSLSTIKRYGRAPKGERAFGKAPRNWGKNVTLISSITTKGMGPSMSIPRAPRTQSLSGST